MVGSAQIKTDEEIAQLPSMHDRPAALPCDEEVGKSEAMKLLGSVLLADGNDIGLGLDGVVQDVSFVKFSKEIGKCASVPLELGFGKQIFLAFGDELAPRKLTSDCPHLRPDCRREFVGGRVLGGWGSFAFGEGFEILANEVVLKRCIRSADIIEGQI